MAKKTTETKLRPGTAVRWMTKAEFKDPYWRKEAPKLPSYGVEGLTIHSKFWSRKWKRVQVTLEKKGEIITMTTTVRGKTKTKPVQFAPWFFLPL